MGVEGWEGSRCVDKEGGKRRVVRQIGTAVSLSGDLLQHQAAGGY